MATFRGEVTSLQTIAVNKIVQSLGERAKSVASVFCCGNTLSSPERVRLACENSGNNWSSVTFPGAEQTAVQQLLGAYGLVKKRRTRATANALTLESDRFLTSFQLYHTPILDEIQKLMLPDERGGVRAELRNLSVHGPGSRVNARVDAPRSNQIFGSLIICLPTQFTGGTLVVRYLEREKRFDWSSSPQNPIQKVSWAAFSSSVEYEVLPVTQGYHLTLTYDLYTVVSMTSSLISTSPLPTSPFCHELCAAVSNPHFLRDGGVLGFRCQNEYTSQDLNQTGDLPHLLKGADSMVYEAGKSLGLPVIVKPVTDHLLYDYILRGRQLVLPMFSHDSCGGWMQLKILRPGYRKKFKKIFGRVHDDKHITWCQDLINLQPAIYVPRPKRRSRARVRVQPPFIVCQVACILVGVPRWGKRQSLLGMSEDAIEPCRKKKKFMETEFGGPEMEELLSGPDWEKL